MKKLINKLLIPILLTSLTTTVVLPNSNINKMKNINLLDENEKIDPKTTFGLMLFIDNLLKDDCLINFQKYYRLNATKFEFLSYKTIADKFKQYVNNKYNCNFNIEPITEDENTYLTDGTNIIKINISLFKINEQWIILNSNLSIHFQLNDSVFKLLFLKQHLFDHRIESFIQNKNFSNYDEVILQINKILNEKKMLSDIKVDANETFFLNSSFKINEYWKNNFIISLNLKTNNYSIPTILRWKNNNPIITNDILLEFKIFNEFKIFILNLTPHINIKSAIPNNIDLTNYTYQTYVAFLNHSFIDFVSTFNDIETDNTYIKLLENQNAIFTDGKNILKLLVAKNETCEQYIEYDLPIYWDNRIKILKITTYDIIINEIFESFNYPNNTMLKSNELHKSQPQKSTYNLISTKIKEKIRNYYRFETIQEESNYPQKFWNTNISDLINSNSLQFINPYVLLKKGHNIVRVIITILDFKLPIDFHINITNSEQDM